MAKRRRILFIGINYRYINPTNALLPGAIARSSDVMFYGPGYVSDATLALGVERALDLAGGCDLVFATLQCCNGGDADRLDRFVHRYAVPLASARVTRHFLEDVQGFCRRNRDRVVCALTDLDPHSVPQSMLDALDQNAGYYLGWGEGFLNTLGDRTTVEREAYLQRKVRMSIPLGLFDAFAASHASRTINLGHMVAETEFYWSSLTARPYDVAVPGSAYARRAAVSRALLASTGLKVAPGAYALPFKLAERAALRPYANFFGVHLYNLAFQRMLSRSRACVTDGGANNFPVRKFFEIPASGALMICFPAVGLTSLGFQDGVHAVFVSGEADVAEAVASVVRDPTRFEEVAARGRALVLAQHSVAARAAQLDAAFTRILDGTFNGSRWVDGEFALEFRSDEVSA